MKKIVVFILFALVPFSATVKADVVGFTGDYAFENWRVSEQGYGYIEYDNSEPEYVIFYSDIDGGDYIDQYDSSLNQDRADMTQDMVVSVQQSGYISFNWSYDLADWNPSSNYTPAYDQFGVTLNNSFYTLMDGSTSAVWSGEEVVSVEVGDIFGFRVNERQDAAATVFIYPFSFSTELAGGGVTVSAPDAPVASTVSEPSTYALMLGGVGLVGYMAARRRKQT